MEESKRKIFLELTRALVKVMLEMSGCNWVTISGNTDNLMFALIKVKNGETEELVNYDIFNGEIKDYAE